MPSTPPTAPSTGTTRASSTTWWSPSTASTRCDSSRSRLEAAPCGAAVGHNAVLLAFLARRLLFAAVALVAVAAVVYVMFDVPPKVPGGFFPPPLRPSRPVPRRPPVTGLLGGHGAARGLPPVR